MTFHQSYRICSLINHIFKSIWLGLVNNYSKTINLKKGKTQKDKNIHQEDSVTVVFGLSVDCTASRSPTHDPAWRAWYLSKSKLCCSSQWKITYTTEHVFFFSLIIAKCLLVASGNVHLFMYFVSLSDVRRFRHWSVLLWFSHQWFSSSHYPSAPGHRELHPGEPHRTL